MILLKVKHSCMLSRNGMSVRRDTVTEKVSVLDVLQHILGGNAVNASQIWHRLVQKHPDLVQKCPTVRLDGKGRLTPVADDCTIREIIERVVASSRLSSAKKHSIMQCWQITPSVPVRTYIEEEILPNVAIALRHLSPQRRFPIGDYVIDMYLPTCRLAVECDENNHAAYDQQLEIVRQTFIETQLHCRFLRFDPYSPDFCVFKLISDILHLL